jgi:cytochrome c-type biogenesis protein CcmH
MKRLLLALALGVAAPAFAQEAQKLYPEVEATAREVGKALRCVVCQNQSIEESAAPLAADMRAIVRERLAAGETREQVLGYMTDRYGNFVLMQPPLQLDTLLLWFGPLLLLIAAVWGWFVYLGPSAKRNLAPPPLSEAEAAELDRHMRKEEQA